MTEAKTSKGSRGFQGFQGSVPLKQLSAFTSQLSTMQDAGLPILRSIRVLEGQLKPSLLKSTLVEVVEDVEGGSSLSEAFARHPRAFDRLYVNMIKAGEAGGVLDVILERLARFLEKDLKLKAKIQGSLLYPCVVTSIVVLISMALLKFVIPQFDLMFEEAAVQLPAVTELLIELSRFTRIYWPVLLLAPFALYTSFKLLWSLELGRRVVDQAKLKVPVFGSVIRMGVVAHFCRTLGTLLDAGIPLLEALRVTRETVGNRIIAELLDDMIESIREGENLVAPLRASTDFDLYFVSLIELGEETGELDRMLIRIADRYDDDVDIFVASLRSILEPVFIVVIGILVGFVTMALMMPLVELIDKL